MVNEVCETHNRKKNNHLKSIIAKHFSIISIYKFKKILN